MAQISHLFYINTDTRQLSTMYTKRISAEAERIHATECALLIGERDSSMVHPMALLLMGTNFKSEIKRVTERLKLKEKKKQLISTRLETITHLSVSQFFFLSI